MTKASILSRITKSKNKRIKFGVTDIDGVLRGKIINLSKFKKGLKTDFGFCNVIFGWDINDSCYDNTKASGWHTGYPDAMASIDLDSFRQIPWDEDAPFFLADFENANSEIANVCPRTLLKRIRQQCVDMGYLPYFANEFEWFNFKKDPSTPTGINPQAITSGMFGYSLLRFSQNQDFVNNIFDWLGKFGIPIEGFHTETGPGVYEAAIQYSEILEAADRAVLFKHGVKEIAARHGFIASFMAKWNEQLPGCSGHIHQSLWDKKGKRNLFYDPARLRQSGGRKNKHKQSELMEQYIAGQLHCLPHIMPMFAPTINSYKRYVSGSWAAVSASWGIENRTTALRVINTDKNGTRLETRVPGSDANPYLSMAAALAAGLYGIRNKLSLKVTATKGNEYENNKTLPLAKNLKDATEKMKKSKLAKELFGAAFVDHFVRTREWEWQQFEKSVTDWELKRYFETI